MRVSLSGLPEDVQTAREGTQGPLRSSAWALPCERAAPNGLGTQVPRCLPLWWPASAGGGLAAPLPQTARGGDPRTPRSLLAHPFLGACAPHAAPRARLPLFHFRPPLPCPWAAAMIRGGVAGLPCCWRLLVNVDAPPCSVPCAAAAWPPGALVLASRATLVASRFLPRATGQLGLARWLLSAGSSPPCRLSAARPSKLSAAFCTSPAHLHFLAPPRSSVSVSELPALQHVTVRTPGPSAMPHLSHAGRLDASR